MNSAPEASDSDLSGKLAVVTGAGSGIGRACARRLARAGARVRVVDIDKDAAEAVAGEVGGEARAVDLTDLELAESLGADADVVVNNAGVQTVSPIEEFPPEKFSMMLRLMVEAPFRLVRAALPHMYANGWGRVVNISSVHGLRASAYKSAYVTAKHALEGFSKVTAVEGGPRGVTSNCVNPGYVRTPLVENQIAAQAENHGISADEVIKHVLLARSPIKRLIEPEEVAAAVTYLCGPEATFINGSSLTIDGAWTAS
ncbi:3-hydroxybutyrate dehydrogenase [Phytoactinopolyspora halotolerans]|uniref:SDR family oxidoreductase n=1 Tax=Phytoactinopolyspora halotolerans TaxID=1981512 RepID=A0A6L9SET8_9ACTN|nr:3-hydroxybutyrate dehydrogenase [Phytoactinopolyspora halotolerans]NEE03001.1 SDR family oxidoreductase [Phytoactinopolyspora halotolerans]